MAVLLSASVRGLDQCECVCHGWPDFERFWPFCLAQLCEVWGQCVCVMGVLVLRGIGHFVVCKCARCGVNICVCVCMPNERRREK